MRIIASRLNTVPLTCSCFGDWCRPLQNGSPWQNACASYLFPESNAAKSWEPIRLLRRMSRVRQPIRLLDCNQCACTVDVIQGATNQVAAFQTNQWFFFGGQHQSQERASVGTDTCRLKKWELSNSCSFHSNRDRSHLFKIKPNGHFIFSRRRDFEQKL